MHSRPLRNGERVLPPRRISEPRPTRSSTRGALQVARRARDGAQVNSSRNELAESSPQRGSGGWRSQEGGPLESRGGRRRAALCSHIARPHSCCPAGSPELTRTSTLFRASSAAVDDNSAPPLLLLPTRTRSTRLPHKRTPTRCKAGRREHLDHPGASPVHPLLARIPDQEGAGTHGLMRLLCGLSAERDQRDRFNGVTAQTLLHRTISF